VNGFPLQAIDVWHEEAWLPPENAWIVRVYECKQYRSNAVTITFEQPIRKAVECNLLEEAPIAYQDNQLTFAIKPFEIKTFKVWF
jgi:alpha-mannosidase